MQTNLAAIAPDTLTGPLRVMVIYNPVAGWRRRRLLTAVLDRLATHGARIELRETTRRGDAERFARDASSRDFDRLVIAGGDGTINEAINGLRDPGLPVAIVPLGTANVLAAELRLLADPASLAAAIGAGRPRRVSIGLVNGRAFTMMAGVGFDAHVVAHVSARLKRATGKLAYVWESLLQLWRYEPRLYELRIDGRTYRAASAIIAKGHFYAGRFVCAPDARLESPELHVCLFGRAGRLHVVRYAFALLFGCLSRLDDVRIVPGRTIEIAGPAGEPVQGDGDLLARLPVSIEVASARLMLVSA